MLEVFSYYTIQAGSHRRHVDRHGGRQAERRRAYGLDGCWSSFLENMVNVCVNHNTLTAALSLNHPETYPAPYWITPKRTTSSPFPAQFSQTKGITHVLPSAQLNVVNLKFDMRHGYSHRHHSFQEIRLIFMPSSTLRVLIRDLFSLIIIMNHFFPAIFRSLFDW